LLVKAIQRLQTVLYHAHNIAFSCSNDTILYK
jgi:hypothetical protein